MLSIGVVVDNGERGDPVPEDDILLVESVDVDVGGMAIEGGVDGVPMEAEGLAVEEVPENDGDVVDPPLLVVEPVDVVFPPAGKV